MFHLVIVKWCFLLLVAAVASIVDTVAGGGGLLVVPALLLCGLAPAMALGTNKLQATFGCGLAVSRFVKAGGIVWQEVVRGLLFCVIGASLGALLIIHMHPDFLRKLIPAVMLVVILYMLLSKDAGHVERRARVSQGAFFIVLGMVLGFYDGFFGPGTGSFWVVSMIALLGWNIKRATMHAKIYNFVSNIVSLAWFVWGGHIEYGLGLAMALSSMLGAQVGARLVVSKSTYFIRPFFVLMMCAMFVCLVYQSFFK